MVNIHLTTTTTRDFYTETALSITFKRHDSFWTCTTITV